MKTEFINKVLIPLLGFFFNFNLYTSDNALDSLIHQLNKQGLVYQAYELTYTYQTIVMQSYLRLTIMMLTFMVLIIINRQALSIWLLNVYKKIKTLPSRIRQAWQWIKRKFSNSNSKNNVQ